MTNDTLTEQQAIERGRELLKEKKEKTMPETQLFYLITYFTLIIVGYGISAGQYPIMTKLIATFCMAVGMLGLLFDLKRWLV